MNKTGSCELSLTRKFYKEKGLGKNPSVKKLYRQNSKLYIKVSATSREYNKKLEELNLLHLPKLVLYREVEYAGIDNYYKVTDKYEANLQPANAGQVKVFSDC